MTTQPNQHPLQIRRLTLGLSRERLAARANVSLATVVRIERGLVAPHPSTRFLIASALHCDEEELFRLGEEM